jgi:predicted  nucleic acid-binding Zn-ribbon protein
MWSVVSRSELQRKMWEVVRSKTEQEQVTCRAYGVSLHQQMISATIALLLTLALAVQPAIPAMPLALTIALVDKQKQSSHTPNRCIHDVSHPEHTAVSLYEQKNTPYTGQHLHDWRDRLKSDIESQGSFQRDSIIRSVAQICQDLETRCNTVEEPLRREKEKTLELEQHVDELNERIATLEVQAADDRFHSEGLEDEKLIISDERDSLIAKLKYLEAETDEAIRKADEVLIQVREDFNAKELEHRSTILIYEETTRALEKETEGQHTTIEKLRDDLANTEHERTVLSEQLESLQQRLSYTENSLNDELHSVLTLSEEIAQLKDRKIELELQLQGTEADLDTMTTRLSDLQVSHQELVQSSEEAYRDIEQRYSSDMDAATVRAQNEREESHTKLQEAIQHGQRIASTHDETRKELQQLQTTIPALTERIQELTEFCSEQEEELEELRTLRKNVLASMGLASQHPLAIRSGSGGQQDAADPPVQTPRVPREHRRRKSALQNLDEAPGASRSTLGATSTAMEFVAKASFASSDSHSSQNGPTPKRSKPRPSSKVPAMQTPYTQKPILSSRSVSKKLSPIKRSALRQMSPNRRHSTVGFAAPENEDERSNDLCSARKRRGSLQGVEEVDFDMEDFLAGTPLTPGNFTTGTGRIPDGDDDDDDDDATATEL